MLPPDLRVVMKQPREAAPIWVWLAFGLMGPGTASYVAGYMVLEDILGFLKCSERPPEVVPTDGVG
jgi:hypothetical protein